MAHAHSRARARTEGGNAADVGDVRAELQDYSESVYRVNMFFVYQH